MNIKEKKIKFYIKKVDDYISNKKFVVNAKPELVATEKKKQADTEAKIKAIEDEKRRIKENCEMIISNENYSLKITFFKVCLWLVLFYIIYAVGSKFNVIVDDL